jgi:glyoxylase-like metal-dependent hydrolase (beta-lactamase superfamily II)
MHRRLSRCSPPLRRVAAPFVAPASPVGFDDRQRSPAATRRSRQEAQMTSVHLLHAGYTGEGVGSSIVLVRDGDARIVVDPGMVKSRSLILDPLAALGVAPESVTHVFLSHHHPDHTVNIALFPNAEVVDFWARYIGDQWLDHDGDGHRLSPRSQLWLTPGHTNEDASLIVEAEDAVYAMTHAWWHADRTPEVDPLADDQAALEASRARLLAAADIVIPGHGGPFRVRPEG